MKKYVLLVILIVVLSISIIYPYPLYEGFDENRIELVISRYNEDLEWLKEEPFNQYPVIIYNKGTNDDFYKPPLLEKNIDLPNVGRESHTYLYHIIDNYDNLANNTVFLPGSTELPNKYERAKNVIYSAKDTNRTTLACVLDNNITKNIYDFKLDNYESSNNNNKQQNVGNDINPSKIRPFGKWFESIFTDNEENNCIVYNGIFNISKKHILQKSKQYYEKLINEVNRHHNEETGHYFERSWYAIFYPYNNDINFV
jgi:hypothetical protein